MLDFSNVAEILVAVGKVVDSIPGAKDDTADQVIATLRTAADNEFTVPVSAGKMADLIELLKENGLVED